MKKRFTLTGAAVLLIALTAGFNWLPWFQKDNSMRDHRIFGEALQNYYQTIFEENLKKYETQILRAKTKADALKLVAKARARVKKTWKFPKTKSPLKAQVLRKKSFGDFELEHVIFKSRENFTVTANFYLPVKRSGKVPAILFLIGHANSGKRSGAYVTACENFARRGIAVLAVDPIQQGERNQYAGETISCTLGHNRMNRQLLAIGETFSDWRTYDAVRAIDYLVTRPEVDTSRIAVNGNSGGGTMTSMIFANDTRLMAAAPSCYITTFCHNVQNELAADGEQMPAGFLSNGGEMADLILARAPAPCLILARKGDFFDVRGARKSYALLKKVYTLLGKPENISLFESPGKHGYAQPSRLKAYEFFTKLFGLKNLSAELGRSTKPEDLDCLGEDGVSGLKGEKTVTQIAAEQAEKLRLERRKKTISKKEMQKKIASLLKIGTVPSVPTYRSLRMTDIDGTIYQRVGITPEKFITTTLFYQDTGQDFELHTKKEVVLMLPNLSVREELMHLFKKENARALFALDPRGMGESEPSTTERLRRLYWDYGADYHYSSLGLMLDKPFIGRRVYDILCAINLLAANGAEKITIKAFGHSRYLAVYAALLSDKKVSLELVGGLPTTYEKAFKHPEAPIPQSFVPFGILKIADIDEIYALLNKY